jgi:hypothetical protein
MRQQPKVTFHKARQIRMPKYLEESACAAPSRIYHPSLPVFFFSLTFTLCAWVCSGSEFQEYFGPASAAPCKAAFVTLYSISTYASGICEFAS